MKSDTAAASYQLRRKDIEAMKLALEALEAQGYECFSDGDGNLEWHVSTCRKRHVDDPCRDRCQLARIAIADLNERLLRD